MPLLLCLIAWLLLVLQLLRSHLLTLLLPCRTTSPTVLHVRTPRELMPIRSTRCKVGESLLAVSWLLLQMLLLTAEGTGSVQGHGGPMHALVIFKTARTASTELVARLKAHPKMCHFEREIGTIKKDEITTMLQRYGLKKFGKQSSISTCTTLTLQGEPKNLSVSRCRL